MAKKKTTRKMTAGRKLRKRRSRRIKQTVRGYYTILIPWSDRPTQWHPTEKSGPFSTLSRGAFKNKADARAWAEKSGIGQSYRIKRIHGSGLG